MNVTYANFISDTSGTAKRLLALLGELEQLDVLWAGSPNYDSLITQGEIDAIPNLTDAGLTTTILGDGEFALASVKGTLANALPALTVLAKLP